ncbi:MAG: restriction endonuclease subunit S [Bacteroidota bacterium]
MTEVLKDIKAGYKETPLGLIPEDWEVKSIDQTLTIGSGKDYKHLNEGKIPVYGTGGIMTYVDECLFNGESVGIGRKGTIDKPVFLSGKFWTVDTLFFTHSFKSSLPKFIYYVFLTINWKRHNEASGVPSLSKTTIDKIKIPLPQLPEQQKIAEILTTVDDKIEVIEERIKQTQELKKGLMQRLLTKGIGHTKFKDSPLGEIPESWEVKCIRDFANVSAGGTPSTKVPEYWNGNIPWMNSGEINLRRIRSVEGRITEVGMNNSSTRLFESGTILMALAGQGKTRGKVAVTEIDTCTNQSLAGIFKLSNVSIEFLFQNLESRYSEIRKMSTGDGGRGGLNLSIINSIRVAVPPLKEQLKIATILSSIDAKLEAQYEKKTTYQELKKGLMQQLLTGKQRVNI